MRKPHLHTGAPAGCPQGKACLVTPSHGKVRCSVCGCNVRSDCFRQVSLGEYLCFRQYFSQFTHCGAWQPESMQQICNCLIGLVDRNYKSAQHRVKRFFGVNAKKPSALLGAGTPFLKHAYCQCRKLCSQPRHSPALPRSAILQQVGNFFECVGSVCFGGHVPYAVRKQDRTVIRNQAVLPFALVELKESPPLC